MPTVVTKPTGAKGAGTKHSHPVRFKGAGAKGAGAKGADAKGADAKGAKEPTITNHSKISKNSFRRDQTLILRLILRLF